MCANHSFISCLISCEANSGINPLPSSSAFKEPFPIPDPPYSFVCGIALTLLPSLLLLVCLIPTQMDPKRQATATTTPTTMPAMAPEARCEDDLEAAGLLDGLDKGALGLLDGLKVSELLNGLDTGVDEDVVANTLDQQMGLRMWKIGIPEDETADEVEEIVLKDVVLELLEDVDEDSTALASAIETFAFALAKFVQQTLI